MPWSITIGRIAGTAVRVHITFILLLVWIAISAYSTGGAAAALDSVVFITLLFGCVVLHEFGHITMARRYGIKTPDVTLLPIGGVASLERIPEKPSQELAVAIAGPAVNFVIAGLLILVTGALLPPDATQIDDPRVSMIARLAAANLFLAIFNMIPAFPMDGGRVLHAVLAMRMGPQRAMQIAAKIGQGFAFVLGFLGLFGNPLLIFIAIFVYIAATGEAQDSVMRGMLTGLSVADAMETRFVSLPITATLGDGVDTLLATPQHEFPVIDGHGKPVGLLVRENLIACLKDKTRDAPLADCVQMPVPTVRLAQPLAEAMQQMRSSGSPAISVIDAEGSLVGLLTNETIAEMMLIKTAQPEWRFARGAGPRSSP